MHGSFGFGGGIGFFVVAEAFFSCADGALEGFLVDDAFVCEGFEDGFVFVAVAALGFCFLPGVCAGVGFCSSSKCAVGTVCVALSAFVAALRWRSAQLLP